MRCSLRFLSAKRCHLAGIFAKTHGTIPSGTQRRNDNTPGPSRLVSRHCRPRLGSGPCPATSYELNNLPLFFFTIKGYNVDKRFNQMSFSFSSPLFCCRVPGARHRVFCCFLDFLQASLQIGICRAVEFKVIVSPNSQSLRTSDRCHWFAISIFRRTRLQ